MTPAPGRALPLAAIVGLASPGWQRDVLCVPPAHLRPHLLVDDARHGVLRSQRTTTRDRQPGWVD